MMLFCGAPATSGQYGHHAVADLELRIGLDVGARRRRADEDSAFAFLKARLGRLSAAAVVEHFGGLPFRKLRDVAHHQRIVEGRARRRDRRSRWPWSQIGRLWNAEKFSTLIQEGQEVVRPQDSARRAQPLRRRADLGPGLRRHLGIEAGGAEQVLVVVEDRRRDVERERQHVAGDVGVIAGHRRQIRGRRKRLGLIPHQFEYRIDRAPRRDHGGGGDLIDLNDGGLAARAEGEDRRRHRFGVVALVARHDPVFGLRGIEIGRELLQLLAEFSRHRVPPHDLGRRIGGGYQDDSRGRGKAQNSQRRFHNNWSK